MSCLGVVLVWFALVLPQASSNAQQTQLVWFDDYLAANEQAAAEGKLTLVWFYDRRSAAANASFESKVLEQPAIVALVQRHCVAVKVPTDSAILSDGKEKKLLDLDAFGEMQHQPGIALVDLSDPQSPLYCHVVSVHPFQREWITAEKLAVLLELPRGTLTQRTLIFAVRTHPEHPASAASHLSQLLAKETEKHADHQAQITLQGHHNWESRFHAINAQLPGGLVAQEVCAESWPGQTLVEAAEECVHSWRQSPGHWEAVGSRHSLFGYDMKRGNNGVWYAAGIFARQH
jgi:hypothetical protein